MSADADSERVLFSFITPIFCFLTANDSIVFGFPAEPLIEETKTKSKKKRRLCLLISTIIQYPGFPSRKTV